MKLKSNSHPCYKYNIYCLNSIIWIFLAFMLPLLTTTQVLASEFRKCEIKMFVKGVGLPETEVIGARFTAWARDRFASHAWRSIAFIANDCAYTLLMKDHQEIPLSCLPNEFSLNNASAVGKSGISGLSTTRVFSLIKKTVCENHRKPKSTVRTIFDTREIDGFVVGYKPVRHSTACPSHNLIKQRVQIIHCNREMPHDPNEWFFKK